MPVVQVRYIVRDIDAAIAFTRSVWGSRSRGGWNRFAIEVEDLRTLVDTLRAHGASFRNEIVTGVGGKRIILNDPSGNPIELFEPTIAEARLNAAQIVGRNTTAE